jgi:aminoglycoside 3-N-acetyltransferase
MRDGKKVWLNVEDYNTSDPHDNYTFEEIALAHLASGCGQRGKIGNAQSYLFDAVDLTDFAINWLETRFGE